jgi:hypothetical protein
MSEPRIDAHEFSEFLHADGRITQSLFGLGMAVPELP